MGIVSVVLAILTVAFLCFPWIEPLVAFVRRHLLARPPAPASTTADDETAVTTSTKSKLRNEKEEVEDIVKDEKDDVHSTAATHRSSTKAASNPPTFAIYDGKNEDDDDDDDALPSVSDPRQWQSLNRCFCEEGGGLVASFLPPGLLQDQLQSAGALLQLGAGGCYHKAKDRKRR
jgi:hypothetical protein